MNISCSEKNYYLWHPLFKYVMDTLNIYALAVNKAYANESITEEEHGVFVESVDFNSMLAFLKDCYDGKYNTSYQGCAILNNLLNIYKPLQINCCNGMVLFKYKSFVDLAEMNMLDGEFWNLYDGLYKECRSVVIDIINNCIVLAPQAKFFNVNENEESSYESIINKIATAKSVEITNKLDGSNQNYRWYNDTVIGSGSSAIDVKESWRLQKGYSLLTPNHYEMMKKYRDYTFMYEFISPDNRIVVNYSIEQEGLYLFGMRNSYTGEELTYSKVLEIAAEYNIKTTEIYQDSFEDIMNQLDDYTSDEKEGWVISVVDNNNNRIFKAKLKVNDYVLMHKALSKLISPNAIIKAIADEKWDDFYSKIPSAYRNDAINIKDTVMDYVNHTNLKIGEYLKRMITELGDSRNDRKTFMIWCNTNVPKDLRGYIVARYDGKSVNLLTKGKSAQGYKKLHELIF